MSTVTELADSMELANYPAVTAFGVATHCSQLKAHTPLAHNAGHSAARSVTKALGERQANWWQALPGYKSNNVIKDCVFYVDKRSK